MGRGWRIIKTMGPAHHQVDSVWRFRGGIGRRSHAHRHSSLWHPGKHDAHNHRGDRGGWRDAKTFGSALGRYAADRFRVDTDDTGSGSGGAAVFHGLQLWLR